MHRTSLIEDTTMYEEFILSKDLDKINEANYFKSVFNFTNIMHVFRNTLYMSLKIANLKQQISSAM